jgi:antitoxin YefM
MKVVGAKEARQNFAALLDSVVDDAEEVVIHRSGGKGDVVVISLDEWNSIKETEYLLRSPANAARLRRAIADLDAGRGEVHDLIDPETAAGSEIA